MDVTELKKGMLVLLWEGGISEKKNAAFVRLNEDAFTDGLNWWIVAGKETERPYPAGWCQPVPAVLLKWPEGQELRERIRAILAETPLEEITGELGEEIAEAVVSSTENGMIPFKLQGDLNAFEKTYLCEIEALLFDGNISSARPLLSAIWNFGNDCWVDGYMQAPFC